MKSIRMIELRTTIPASAIMPIMAVAVKNVGLAIAGDRLVGEQVQQPESRHDADHRQRNGHHDDQRNQQRAGLRHQQHADQQQRHAEGQAQVAEHVTVMFHSPSPAQSTCSPPAAVARQRVFKSRTALTGLRPPYRPSPSPTGAGPCGRWLLFHRARATAPNSPSGTRLRPQPRTRSASSSARWSATPAACATRFPGGALGRDVGACRPRRRRAPAASVSRNFRDR